MAHDGRWWVNSPAAIVRRLLGLFAWQCLCCSAIAGAQGIPLSLENVSTLLRDGVRPSRIISLAQQHCLGFRPTNREADVLRRSGADESLLRELASVCVREAPRTQTRRPPVTQGRSPGIQQPDSVKIDATYGAGSGLSVGFATARLPACCGNAELLLSSSVDGGPDRTRVRPSRTAGPTNRSGVVPSFSVGFAPRRFGAFGELDYLFIPDGLAGGVSVGVEPFLPVLATRVRVLVRVAARGEWIDAPIGDVGSGEADGYIQIVGGERIQAPATVMMRGGMVGGEASTGLAINISRRASLAATLGYRYLRGAGPWTFRVQQGARMSLLDATGMPFVQSELRTRGLVGRIGVRF